MNSITAMSKINDIDLEQIKVKLMHAQSGEGWSRTRADAIEVEYRRFLCMLHLYPEESFAPLLDVDTFWHYHILDTRKYAADCEQTFGYFMHHHPYVGLGEDDAADHQAYGDRMHALYQATFGEACLSGVDAAAGAGDAPTAWCSRVDVQAQGTAWCSRVDGAARAQASAWCSLNAGKPQATAWCSLNAGKSLASAWCSLTTGNKPQQTAWCSRDAATPRATAWCSLNAGNRQEQAQQAQQTAWCSRDAAARPPATAWCSQSASAKATAWCSATATLQAV